MLRFEPVTARATAILIVGSGPSAAPLSGMVVPRRVHVMAVKSAVHGLSRVSSWMTVDPNNRTRQYMMAHPIPGIRYYAAVPEDYGTPDALRGAHRLAAERGIHFLRRLCTTPVGTSGLSQDPTTIHSGNSAYGALGLAHHMWPRRIGIVGVDLTHENYVWRGSSPQRRPHGSMEHVPELFVSAIPDLHNRGIEVRSASGPLLPLERMELREMIHWLAAA